MTVGASLKFSEAKVRRLGSVLDGFRKQSEGAEIDKAKDKEVKKRERDKAKMINNILG